MRPISEEKPFWNKLMSMLEAQFGEQCEIVLHDLTKDYSETISDFLGISKFTLYNDLDLARKTDADGA